MIQYMLTIDRQGTGYSDRLKVSRELNAAIIKNKLRHTTIWGAERAALEISKSPLVDSVTVTRVDEKKSSTWRNGRKSPT